MPIAQQVRLIKIGLASPQKILSWSSGEVKKPETINYRTFKPERDGLFCEKIFGPTKDWECYCGRYKKIKYRGIICDKCGVQVTRSQVRRRRMGHIKLAAPVCHIWYLKAVPSPIGLLLDMPPKALEEVAYFASYIVTHCNREKILACWKDFEQTAEEQIAAVRADCNRRKNENFRTYMQQVKETEDISEREKAALKRELEEKNAEEDSASESRIQEISEALKLLHSIQEKQLIKEIEYRHLMQLLDRTSQRTEQNLKNLLRAAPGAEALKVLLENLDLEELARELREEIEQSNRSNAKRQKAIKRLACVNWFRKSKNRPEWMVLEMLPVLPPDLRPMVQLDGGRFATSDVNDLYRRVINRNNRLKRIMEIRAPESIINHEKRLLQEAVDALIDNNRRRRPVTGANRRELKSLTDMLKGKEGRFRKNLLGKRVDYSGRTVIVIGPELQLHECGLPREMALELFKPMVIRRLYEQDSSRSIKKTKRMVERLESDVWDALEEVVKDHPVLLNRAPTLHRLGVQAFTPKLVDGKALQIHPLVCHAFNADFDGDAMQVHVPLSIYSQAEALMLMLSSRNLFKPGDGTPIVSPLFDVVLGCAYMTQPGESSSPARVDTFANPTEAIRRYETRTIDLHAPIKVRLWNITLSLSRAGGELLEAQAKAQITDGFLSLLESDLGARAGEFKIRLNDFKASEVLKGEDAHPARERLRELLAKLQEQGELPSIGQLTIKATRKMTTTTVGRLIFNQLLPLPLRDYETEIDKKKLADLTRRIHTLYGSERTVQFLEQVKALGFYFATIAGISISLRDMDIPTNRQELIDGTQTEVDKIGAHFSRGLITAGEKEQRVVQLWQRARDDVGQAILRNISRFNPVYLMVDSGARGNMQQVGQLSGMRGLMQDPFGRLIEDLPVKGNFHEGLSILEYFVSTHGARKGLADTALRTADAGYLTRKLVDVAQEVIVRELDCGTTEGILAKPFYEEDLFCRICGEEDLHRRGKCFYCGEPLPEASSELVEDLRERIIGRISVEPVVDPHNGEIIVERDQLITEEVADLIDKASIRRVNIRSPLACNTDRGICAMCYGIDMATQGLVEVGEAVGVIAAQSIGEPGTQLTLRTFHTGGVAAQYLTGVADVRRRKQDNLRQLRGDIEKGIVGLDATGGREQAKAIQDVLKLLEDPVGGILRVVELLEARKPKGQAIVSDVDGIIDRIETEPMRRVIIAHEQNMAEAKGRLNVEAIINPKSKKVIVPPGAFDADKLKKQPLPYVTTERAYLVPYRGYLQVQAGMRVRAGDRLTQGPLNPDDILETKGVRAAQEYLLRGVQAVYRAHAVDTNDKHVEVIIAQMFRKRRIQDPSDTEFLPGELVDVARFEEENTLISQQGGKEATALPVLLGITEASLATESFLSAASFQKTTKVLTEAAIQGKEDALFGLKENVIIGRLIPAGTGFYEHARTTIVSEPQPAEEEVEIPAPEEAEAIPEPTVDSLEVS